MRLFLVGLLASAALYAQAPRVGIIDFYGLRKVSEARIRTALGFSEGQPIPGSKGDIEDRLAMVPGIVDAHLEATCCERGTAVLYVGVEEKGAPHFDLRTPPDQDLSLPEAITNAYQEFLDRVADAVHNGQTQEDLTQGHSLMAYPEARAVQEHFVDLAADHLSELRQVIHKSADPTQRAMAAYVIGYAPDKAAIVGDLQYALTDPDDTVRSNAIRALAAVAVKARLDPKAHIKIEPTWFIEMLNSLSWTDRNNSAVALVTLTDDRDRNALDQMRDRALASLIEMARWKKLEHALPAYILLGRVLGMPEKDLQDAWSRGARDTVIAKAMKLKPRKEVNPGPARKPGDKIQY